MSKERTTLRGKGQRRSVRRKSSAGRRPSLADRAESLRANGELAEAIQVARSGLGRDPDNQGARVVLSHALLDTGDSTEARAELEKVLRAEPENAIAARLLDECLQNQKDAAPEPEMPESAVPWKPHDGAKPESTEDVMGLDASEIIEEAPASRTQQEAASGHEIDGTMLSWEPDRGVEPESTDGTPQPDSPEVLEESPGFGTRDSLGDARALLPQGRPGPGAKRPEFVDFWDQGVATTSREFPMAESLADPTSIVGETLRLLAARVQEIRRKHRADCLAFTSPIPGDGKSTLALAVASALGRSRRQKVLLIEADLRRPSISRALGLPAAPGLGEWLTEEVEAVPLRGIEPGGFSLVSAGERPLEQPEIMGSARMESLLRAAREIFDVVLLDVVPLLPVADAVLMQDLVDGFLLVVRSRSTPRTAVKEAFAKLKSDRILGMILNDHRVTRTSYSSYGYARYGMSDLDGDSGHRKEPRK